jgi:hypothetical protein
MKLHKHIIVGLFAVYILSSAFSHAQFAQAEDQTLSEFDVQTAAQNMKDLQSSVDDITTELYAMDAKEKTEDGISDKYRETRNEVVDVIGNITKTTEDVGLMLKKIATYKMQIASASEELKAARE